VNCFAQLAQFSIRQVSPRAARNRSKLKGPHPDTDQAQHRIPDFLEHLAHNTVTALMNDDLYDRSVFGVSHRPNHRRCCALTVDHYATPDPVQHLRRRVSVEQGFVLLLDFEPRMHDTVGNLPVIRQQQQPLGLTIEPTDGNHSLVDRYKIHHRVPPALVGRCGDVAARLVQQYVSEARTRDQFAVDLDLLALSINLCSKLRDNLAINADPARNNHLFGFSSRRYSAGRKDSLKTFHNVVILSRESPRS
jgi:hypothetical protein